MSNFVAYSKEKMVVDNKIIKDNEFIMKNDGEKFVVENLKDGTVNIGYRVNDDDFLKSVFDVDKRESILDRLKTDIKALSDKKSKDKKSKDKKSKDKANKTRRKKSRKSKKKSRKNKNYIRN